MISDLNKMAGGSRESQPKWEFMQCQKFKYLYEFDTCLFKSIKICLKHTPEIGEDGWFIILEFLSNYITQVTDKLNQLKNSGATGSAAKQEKLSVERLLDFVKKRKASILKEIPATVSL